MDLRQLRYFVGIVEAGSFSRAAARLHVAQPALSLHVRNMEADLGTELLRRTPQGIVPTEAGSRLAAHARQILADLASARRDVLALAAAPSGEVRIGLPATLAEHLAVPLILAARARFPEVRLRVAEAMSGFVLDWLREERVDLALLFSPVEERGLSSVPVLVEPLRLFGPAEGVPGVPAPRAGEGGSVPFATLATLPLVLPSPGHGLRALLDERAGLEGVRLSTLVDLDAYAAIKALVARGLAYAILPEASIAADVAEGRLVAWGVGRPAAERTVHLVRPFERPVAPAVTAVAILLEEVVAGLVASGAWPARPARPLRTDGTAEQEAG